MNTAGTNKAKSELKERREDEERFLIAVFILACIGLAIGITLGLIAFK